MSGSNATDPFKRFKTRHRGITYRETAEGRTYYVYAQGKQHRVDGGGEQEAVAKQAELRGKIQAAAAPHREAFVRRGGRSCLHA